MGLTHLAAFAACVGVALITAGAFLLLGAWALIAAGVVLVLAGLVPDWERDR